MKIKDLNSLTLGKELSDVNSKIFMSSTVGATCS